MFDRFTRSAKWVTFFAEQYVKEIGHRQVEPEHLLIGLVLDPETVANQVIASFGVVPTNIGDRLAAQQTSGHSVHKGPVGYGRGAKKVMRLAVKEAQAATSRDITTQHLLLALLREGSSQTAEAFSAAGLQLEPVRTRIAELTDPAGPARRDPDLMPDERADAKGLRVTGVTIDRPVEPDPPS